MFSWRLFLFLFPSFTFLSCLKKDTGCSYRIENTKAPVAEQQALLSYLTSNSITAVKDSSGLYYQVTNAGTGTSPNLCSTIQINYLGKLVNGSVFDGRDNTVFVLGTLIDGWKIGIPLIKKGGQIRLFIPPSLGYGSSDVRDQSGRVVIPGNSILIFDITLLDFQ
jgi:FKBP-type peptidyl-prolyl cis-trans isomerase FkpA